MDIPLLPLLVIIEGYVLLLPLLCGYYPTSPTVIIEGYIIINIIVTVSICPLLPLLVIIEGYVLLLLLLLCKYVPTSPISYY